MTDMGSNSKAALEAIIKRAQEIEGRRKDAVQDLKDLWKEAESNGFEPDALKVILKDLEEDAKKKEKRERKESIADVYRAALGMLSDTPLGQAAIRSVA